MYLQHFGLAQYPFSLTPNTRYFLKLPSHQLVFDSLIRSLRDEGCFSVVTGEVGTGKTLLCRKVLNALELHPSRFVTAFIPHPILNEEAIMRHIADELHVDTAEISNYRSLLKQITRVILEYARTNRQVVLFVDEAQAIPEESLRAIHLLTQVRFEDQPPMQIVLFGQPELEAMLERPGLGQIKDSISFRYVLPELDREGVEAYVEHRLAKAGYSGRHMFTSSALSSLLEHSGGVPRMINILCHKAMLVAYGKGERLIDDPHVQRAVEDTFPDKQKSSWLNRIFPGKES